MDGKDYPCGMISSRLTSKAQTTVPQAVRNALGVGPGDDLAYEIMGDSVRLTKARPAGRDDPFVHFDEWATEADARAYAEL